MDVQTRPERSQEEYATTNKGGQGTPEPLEDIEHKPSIIECNYIYIYIYLKIYYPS